MSNKTASSDLAGRGQRVWMTTTNRPNMAFVRGEGMRLYDESGKAYLDFAGGWAVCSLGHSPAVVATALAAQASTLLHCSPGYWNPKAVELAEALCLRTGMDRVFLGSTGAEANECAIKLARKYGATMLGGASQIVVCSNAFHGRTLATMSASGKPGWETLFEPKVSGFVRVPYNDVEALNKVVDSSVCAILMEPVLGEAGAIAASTEFVAAARGLCTRTGALLMFDEVQTGMGRCGHWTAYQGLGVLPDVVTLGKGLGAGFPLSACLTRNAFDRFEVGDQGGTFSFHPLGAAVGLVVLEEMERLDLFQNVTQREAQIRQELGKLSPKHGLANIRGKGLLLACDLPRDCAAQVVAEATNLGLLLNAPGPNTLRFIPPLIVSKADVQEWADLLARSLDRVL